MAQAFGLGPPGVEVEGVVGPECDVAVLVAYFASQPVGIDAVGAYRSAFRSRVSSLLGDRSLAIGQPGRLATAKIRRG
jgi:hypothetical protein